DVKTEAALIAVIAALKAAGEPLKAGEIEEACEAPRDITRAAVKEAKRRDIVACELGARGAKLHRIAYPCAQCGLPVTSRRERHESCPPGVEASLHET